MMVQWISTGWNDMERRDCRLKSPDYVVSFFLLLLVLGTPLIFGQNAPPTLESMAPYGGQSGTSVTVLIDGTNLGEATRLFFNRSGLSSSILKNRELPNKKPGPEEGVVVTGARIEDGATKNRLNVEISIGEAAPTGIHGFRVLTPVGLSNMMHFSVGAFPEVTEEQANDTPEQAQNILLPATVNGEISQSGDVDHFSFKAGKGQELVFEIVSSPLGSKLDPELVLLRDGIVVAEDDDSRVDSLLIHRTREDGIYTIRISDVRYGSGNRHYYRLNAGAFPYVTEVFPLGIRSGEETVVTVKGANLGGMRSVTVSASASGWRRSISLSVPPALNEVDLAVGVYVEMLEREPNSAIATAQEVELPVTINGHIFHNSLSEGQKRPDRDLFRFRARRGQKLILEVDARGLGSLLDSVLEVLNDEGKPVPRATVRCVAQTHLDFRDHDSRTPGIRVLSDQDLAIDDRIMLGGEILQIEALPRTPDDNVIVRNFLGRRMALLDTTSEVHSQGDPIYKVEIFPPGRRFPPNGMPVFHLDYRNDDAGPLLETDSRIDFTAPEEGFYLVRLSDVRGFQGQRYTYRLTIREPKPDFELALDTRTLNVPAGGQIPIRVVAYRADGFDGQIELSIEDLPEVLSANPGVIAANQDSAVLRLHANSNPAFDPVPLRVVGRAKRVDREDLVRLLEGEKQLYTIARSLPPDIGIQLDRHRVEIVPGSDIRVTVQVNRREGFRARVPVEIRNLPRGVRVLDIGLNGILITEEQTSRTFTLYAEPWARPGRRPFYAVGEVETNSFLPVEHVSAPVELVVLNLDQ